MNLPTESPAWNSGETGDVKGKKDNAETQSSQRSAERKEGYSTKDPSPVFFVSVASKGVSRAVSLLFATVARGSISVAAKGLRETGRLKVES